MIVIIVIISTANILTNFLIQALQLEIQAIVKTLLSLLNGIRISYKEPLLGRFHQVGGRYTLYCRVRLSP